MSKTKTATAAETTWDEAEKIDRAAAAKRRAALGRRDTAGGFTPEDLDAIFSNGLAEDGGSDATEAEGAAGEGEGQSSGADQ